MPDGFEDRSPVDGRAVYGYSLEDHGVPVHDGVGCLRRAIRSVSPGDRVRVNGGGWMRAVEPDDGFVDEGFLAVPESGSVKYAVRPVDHGGREPRARMRRWANGDSAGVVEWLEVDWA